MPLVKFASDTPDFRGLFHAPNAWITGKVFVDEGSSIWFGVTIRGDVQPVRIGRDCNIQDQSVLHGTSGVAGVSLGDRVSVGHGAILHACTIEDDVLIGMGATVLDGSVIQSQVIVAAGGLVPPGRILESGYLYAGAPVQQKRALTNKEKESFDLLSKRYIELAGQYQNMEVLP